MSGEIERFELRRIQLPLVRPFQTAFGTWTERDVLLVRIVRDGAEGWGECVAGTAPTYSSEYTDGAHRVIRDHLAPLMLAAGPVTAADCAGVLARLKGHRMAKATVEAAVLDAQLRADGTAMAAALGGVQERVPVGVSVGIPESIQALGDIVAEHLDDGYRRIKLKIKPGFDVDPVGAVRERFGADLQLQCDANASYDAADQSHWTELEALDEFSMVLIEQPFPEEQVLPHADLAARVDTPICLDESILDVATTEEALRLEACSIVNIKPGRVGGLLEAARIHDRCVDQGIPVWCGGMLETGIGRAANLALASLPGFTLPGDISASARYWDRDIVTEPFTVEDGTMAVPSGPGIGVEVDHDHLDSVTTTVEELSRP